MYTNVLRPLSKVALLQGCTITCITWFVFVKGHRMWCYFSTELTEGNGIKCWEQLMYTEDLYDRFSNHSLLFFALNIIQLFQIGSKKIISTLCFNCFRCYIMSLSKEPLKTKWSTCVCGGSVKHFRNRYSTLTVYTETGPYTCKHLGYRCTDCSRGYYFGYSSVSEVEEECLKNDVRRKFTQLYDEDCLEQKVSFFQIKFL